MLSFLNQKYSLNDLFNGEIVQYGRGGKSDSIKSIKETQKLLDAIYKDYLKVNVPVGVIREKSKIVGKKAKEEWINSDEYKKEYKRRSDALKKNPDAKFEDRFDYDGLKHFWGAQGKYEDAEFKKNKYPTGHSDFIQIYVRAGLPRKDKGKFAPSIGNYFGQDVFEEGVSVFRAEYYGKSGWIVVDTGASTRLTMDYDEASANKRELYLVEGKEIGEGHDDEPILDAKTIKVIGQINPEKVVNDEGSYAGYTYTEKRMEEHPLANFKGNKYGNGGKTKTPEFKKWFKDSKVVDDKGNPLIVYHGTTHNWTEYSEEKGNLYNFFGVGFYASSNHEDVEKNYKAVGMDLTKRIEILADNLSEKEAQEKGILYTDRKKRDELYKKAKLKAKKELVGSKRHIIEVYLSIQNPLILTDSRKGTNFDLGYNYDEENNEATESDDRIKLTEIIQNLLYDKYSEFNIDQSKVFETLDDIEDITANNLLEKLRENEYLLDYLCCSDKGESLMFNFIRDIFIEWGFDGVIDELPATRFNMGVPSGTKHYIVWNSNQIKLASSNTKFDINNPDIRYENGGEAEEITTEYDGARYTTKDHKAYADVEKSSDGWHIEMIESSKVGGGKSILNKIISDAKESRIEKITLSAINSSDGFFEKFGFKKLTTSEIRDNDIPMELQINQI